jgi:diguanylate cyclase (GGDEF)-like protein
MNQLDTVRTPPNRPVSTAKRKACLVQIYPNGPGMGSLHNLDEGSLLIGREDQCDIRLDDPAVSRQHLRITARPDGYYVMDLQSTNGTFVNDQPVAVHRLGDGDYVRIGHRIFRYLTGDNVEADFLEEIHRLAIIDALTGVHNKRFLLEFLERELARCTRYHRPLGLILFDLDHFKDINDRFGHLAGDFTLRDVAGCVRKAVRKEELLARYGGEEFALVLCETDGPGALNAAERIRRLIEQHPFQHNGERFQVTASLGTVVTQEGKPVSLEELIRYADEKLYEAKEAGRNCVRA